MDSVYSDFSVEYPEKIWNAYIIVRGYDLYGADNKRGRTWKWLFITAFQNSWYYRRIRSVHTQTMGRPIILRLKIVGCGNTSVQTSALKFFRCNELNGWWPSDVYLSGFQFNYLNWMDELQISFHHFLGTPTNWLSALVWWLSEQSLRLFAVYLIDSSD